MAGIAVGVAGPAMQPVEIREAFAAPPEHRRHRKVGGGTDQPNEGIVRCRFDRRVQIREGCLHVVEADESGTGHDLPKPSDGIVAGQQRVGGAPPRAREREAGINLQCPVEGVDGQVRPRRLEGRGCQMVCGQPGRERIAAGTALLLPDRFVLGDHRSSPSLLGLIQTVDLRRRNDGLDRRRRRRAAGRQETVSHRRHSRGQPRPQERAADDATVRVLHCRFPPDPDSDG